MLNVVPITSNIEEVVEHFDENGKSVATAPILNIKEAGTVIYANDNDLISIGGLINNTISKTQEKLPGLGDLPGIGQFFTKTINTAEKPVEHSSYCKFMITHWSIVHLQQR